MTILRAADEDEAGSIAAEDPFAVQGLRTFTVHRWRLNEGSIGIRLVAPRRATTFASGNQASVDRVAPVLDAVSGAWVYTGEFGTGARMKYVANLLLAVHTVAAAEAIALARRSGLDLDLVQDTLGHPAGAGRGLGAGRGGAARPGHRRRPGRRVRRTAAAAALAPQGGLRRRQLPPPHEGDGRRDPAAGWRPFFFLKAPTTTIVGPHDPIVVRSPDEARYDWEAELAAVIGIGGRDIPAAGALAHVAG